jgi:amidohydrolase
MVYLQEKISAEVDRLEKEVIEIRRDLHMHPELSGKEERTSSIVSKYLEDLGLEIRRCEKNYGVVGILRGEKTGPTVALRADMDALALEEKTGLPSGFGSSRAPSSIIPTAPPGKNSSDG